MKTTIFLFFITLIHINCFAQKIESLFIEAELVTKISCGKTNRTNINYAPGISVNFPQRSRFNNPVLGTDLTLNYKLNKYCSVGVGSGINIVKFEFHPVISNEYYDKVFFPAFIRIRYLQELSMNWFITADVNTGYQFEDSKFNFSSEGFYYSESGGMIFNINLRVGKNIGAHSVSVNIGYETNQFSHEDSLGDLGIPGLKYSDKVFYKTTYHLINIGMGLKI